ncbi:MAG: hypothetical protein MI919_42760 [Holophagales bacterium]|nr:hypothetical protein [Holophagales bacterium]
MIAGSNRLFEHDGKSYHLQAEDLGKDSGVFEIRVYDGGTVVWQKRVSYGELAGQGLERAELEAALRSKMEKTMLTVEAAIAKGKIV